MGCAIVFHQVELIRYALPNCYSVLFAIKLAVEYASNAQESYIIYTDSLNSIKCRSKYRIRSQHPTAKEIISLLISLSHKVIFVRIPSHRGIVQNDVVDRATKEAARCFPIPNIRIPKCDDMFKVRSYLCEKWSDSWKFIPSTNNLAESNPQPNLGILRFAPTKKKRSHFAVCELAIQN